jgi:hypothetical protein
VLSKRSLAFLNRKLVGCVRVACLPARQVAFASVQTHGKDRWEKSAYAGLAMSGAYFILRESQRIQSSQDDCQTVAGGEVTWHVEIRRLKS